MNNLEAFKLEENINKIVRKGLETYPDDIYLSEFNIDEFLESSKFDQKYLPDDRLKLKNKLKIFNLIKKYLKGTNDNSISFDKYFSIFDRLAKYKVQIPEDSFETNLINEVNASVISDICSYMVSYGISFEESLDFSILNCYNDLTYINLKLKFYSKSIEICKKANLTINFKGN